MKTTRLLCLAAALVLAVSPTGCFLALAAARSDSMEIVYKSPKLTLAWDPPTSEIPGRPSAVANYQIYFRKHGESYWRFLGEISASSHPEYTVEHNKLGNGLFDFAVSAVSKEGSLSPLHTSLDSSADPISGWYVLWATPD